VTARLFLRVMGTEARRRLAYRADFWVNALLAFAAELTIAWFLWQAVFAESGKTIIGGRNFHDTVLYYVLVLLVAKLVRPPFGGGGDVSEEIYSGALSRYLVYPVGYFPFKYAQFLGSLLPVALQAVVFAAAFPFVLTDATARIGPAGVAMGLVSLAAANLLHYLMAYAIQAVAFWADNVWNLVVGLRLVTGLLGGVALPLSTFPEGVQSALRATPFPYLFSEPVATLLGERSLGEWAVSVAITLAWCGAFGLVASAVFRRGRLRYTGVGI
jgi:ABC-2 type transport system permease protein